MSVRPAHSEPVCPCGSAARRSLISAKLVCLELNLQGARQRPLFILPVHLARRLALQTLFASPRRQIDFRPLDAAHLNNQVSTFIYLDLDFDLDSKPIAAATATTAAHDDDAGDEEMRRARSRKNLRLAKRLRNTGTGQR